MFRQLWKTIQTVLLVMGVALSFFAVVEVLRAYEILRDLHPALGWLFGIAVLAGLVWVGIRYGMTVARRPFILVPPVQADPDHPSAADGRAYARYLTRVMKRLVINEQLPDEQRRSVEAGLLALQNDMRAAGKDGALHEAARAAEDGVIQPAIDSLDRLAEKEVRRCVRDVMLGVTLSPWRSVDLMVVLYRNVGMVSQVIAIYNARPRLKEQFLVFKDVLTIVATVNYLNYGSKLSQNLLASVPGLGRFTDDVAQGVGAGLLTSIAGHSTRERCRDFRGWNRVEAERTIVNTLGRFMADVKGIMLDQVLPHLHLEFMDRMRQGIATAMDETAKATDTIVRKPIVAAGRGITYTGTAVTSTVLQGGQLAWSGVAAVGKTTGHVIGRAGELGKRGVLHAGTVAARGWRHGMDAVRHVVRHDTKEGDKE